MVAISLYRGNMHRVPPDVPRRWLMPTPKISLKDFRTLLHRRSRALSLLPSSSSAAANVTTSAAAEGNTSAVPCSPSQQTLVQDAVLDEVRAAEKPNSSPVDAKGAADGGGGGGEAFAIKVEVEVDDDCDVKAVVQQPVDQVASLIGDEKAAKAVADKEEEKEKDVAVEKPALEVCLFGF